MRKDLIGETRIPGRNNGGNLASKASRVLDEGEEVAEEAEGLLRRYKDKALSGAKAVDTRVRGMASAHPVVTVLMALGLGYGLGYLIYRRVKAA
jgi:hypothetical protein